ncbi:MAG: hypothetical protein ACI4TW_03670 [Prevotella sp.]
MDESRVHSNTKHGKRRNEYNASKFKAESLMAIRRRKYFKKYAFIALVVIALLSFAVVIFAYIFDK